MPRYLRLIFIYLVCLTAHLVGYGQDSTQLYLDKIQLYLGANDAADQYDILSDLLNMSDPLDFNKLDLAIKENSISDPRIPAIKEFIRANDFYNKYKKDDAYASYIKMAEIGASIENKMIQSSGIGNASYLLSEKGELLQCLDLLKENLHVAANTGDLRDLSDFYSVIATTYNGLGMPDSSNYYFERTIEIDRKTNNISGMLANTKTLLEQYQRLDEVKKGLALCDDYIELADKVKSQGDQAYALFYKSIFLSKQNDYSEALAAIEKAIDIAEESKSVRIYSNLYLTRAKILEATGKINEAEADFKKSITFAEKEKDLTDYITASIDYGTHLTKQGDPAEALYILENVKSKIDSNQLKVYYPRIYNALAEVHKKRKNYGAAIQYQEKEIEIIKTNLDMKMLDMSKSNQTNLDLYKMEEKNRALELEKKIAEDVSRRRKSMFTFFLILTALLGGILWFVWVNQKQKQQLQQEKAKQEATNLEYQLIEKELSSLRSQMNPHFLFNSLSSINDYIMHEEPQLASRYLTKFSKLMRMILNNSKEKMITLEDEINAIELYVEMENLRFRNKFGFDLQVDPDLDRLQIMIPSMLIQPYIENSIKHGIRYLDDGGLIALQIEGQGEELHIRVEDNGIGRIESMKQKSGKDMMQKSHGMDITSNRIELLNKVHNIDPKIEIIDKENPTGTVVKIRLKKYLKSMMNES